MFDRFADGLTMAARTAVGLLMVTVMAQARAAEPAMNYLMHCQGCHQADGSGLNGYVPSFRGEIGQFLALPEGRQYLGRVPGIAQSLLNDVDRAAVLNFVLKTFDPQHVPESFTPYSADEMARYRKDPISQASAVRGQLLAQLSSQDAGAVRAASYRSDANPTEAVPKAGSVPAPPSFALCAACHPTSADGASAMGPNLRGVVGRKAGSVSAFRYSAAMKGSGIVWTRTALDRYLSNVQGTVPGTLMAIAGVPVAEDRAAIIEYLESMH